ncbi:MAG TPA: carboxypeptidase-like regulatory domain-containing protein, partial [Flavisolibacter sp.]|nr:carboxypeptidase-like regulatory domain-containing protein [Flavisolibacter sp.]
MRKSFCFSAVLITALFFTFNTAFAQTVNITGTVRDVMNTQRGVPAVSVTVKGGTQGTFTDAEGNFRLSVPSLPVVLVFSSVGFETQEVTVTSAASSLSVDLVAGSTLGQEVVVAATRTPQRILESPVSIERVGLATIQNAAVPSYYDIVKNLKGVDLITSSLTFKTVGTRGFNGSGNLRFNQLTDGMDNQAPGLNFSVGNTIGPTELDVDNFELLQGASSALYGSGGTNGTLLLNSKNPFRYQGFSFQIKQGINHIQSNRGTPAPYYDWSMRWAKSIGDRFAFKISSQLLRAQDWEANDTRNLLRTNVFSSIKEGSRRTDPNYDGVNVFGDEASVSMNSLAQAVAAVVGSQG